MDHLFKNLLMVSISLKLFSQNNYDFISGDDNKFRPILVEVDQTPITNDFKAFFGSKVFILYVICMRYKWDPYNVASVSV